MLACNKDNHGYRDNCRYKNNHGYRDNCRYKDNYSYRDNKRRWQPMPDILSELMSNIAPLITSVVIFLTIVCLFRRLALFNYINVENC